MIIDAIHSCQTENYSSTVIKTVSTFNITNHLSKMNHLHLCILIVWIKTKKCSTGLSVGLMQVLTSINFYGISFFFVFRY